MLSECEYSELGWVDSDLVSDYTEQPVLNAFLTMPDSPTTSPHTHASLMHQHNTFPHVTSSRF